MSDAADRLNLLLGGLAGDDPDWPLVHRTLADLSGLLATLHCESFDSDWLVDAIDQLVEGVTVGRSDQRLGPRRGIITDYPIFSGLAAQPTHHGHHRLLRHLQALYLLAAADREACVVSSRYHSPLASAGRACRRRVARGVLTDDRLRAAVLAASTPEALCDSLEQLVGPEDALATSDDELIVKELLPLLRDVRYDRAPRFVKPGKRRRHGSRATVQTQRDSERTGTRVQSYKLIEDKLSDDQRAEMRSEGLAATHETTRSNLYTASPPSRNDDFPAHTQTDYQATQRLILRARALKTGQQPIPNRKDTLHEPALVPLISPGSGWSSQKVLNPTQLAAAMLGTMLLLGCEIKDLGKLRVWSTREEVPPAISVGGIVVDTQQVVLPVPALPDSWHPEFDHQSRHRLTHASLHLPLPTFLPIAQGLLAHAGRRCGKTLFDDGDFAEQAKTAIKSINDKRNTELTRPRITRYLWSATYAMDGDMAEALLLSHGHRDTNDPRLYYYAPSRDHLARQYQRIWTKLAVSTGFDVSDRMQSIPAQYGHVGSAAVPRLHSIQATIDTFRKRLQALVATRGRRSAEQWVAIHNALTVYVVRQIQWLTGIRAVRDPIELDLYDPQSGYLGVIDKDSDDRYGARVVWLIEPVRQQIDRYLQRAESASLTIFGHSDSSAAFRLIDSETLAILPIDQKGLLAFTPEYPYAPNAHRHYTRTRLRELGVDADFVDAWLGHGGIGREPYSRHSAMKPEEMRRAVEPALMTIWKELGWEVLPSQ